MSTKNLYQQVIQRLPTALLMTTLIFISLGAMAQVLTPGVQANAKTAEQTQDCDPNSADCNKKEETEKQPTLTLDEVIPIDEIVNDWEQWIQNTVDDHVANKSAFAKLVASASILVIIAILVAIIAFVLKKLLVKINESRLPITIEPHRLTFYHKGISLLSWAVGLMVFAMVLTAVWLEAGRAQGLREWILSGFASLTNIAALFVLGTAIFEVIYAVLERYFSQASTSGGARAHTILPIIRNVIYGALITLFVITLISELGINVMPLLAGAGVLGFAVGFAAQALLKDILTGFVIILEDLIQVGDVVSVGGKTGVIERITLRKVQLRDLSGIVYTVPYSEITIVENMTKLFSYALLDIGIAYRENTDSVVAELRKLGEEIRQDENYEAKIIAEEEILGVDSLGDNAVVIRMRFKTQAGSQWEIKREFLRRVKLRFDELNIEIPFPHRTLYFGVDKESNPTAMKILTSQKPTNNAQDVTQKSSKTDANPATSETPDMDN